ncbi:glycosyl hydrolase family 18 protein [Paenibacillus thalictri]|uniref:Glycosyl hydrolase n=1 Tax=Paenibacillus thalictri TaxID=2527873 RepID=A0A4Q9DU89_9BACL|nr:glycosyl hydrolase family 18 protein [Paenibacillus thalictri]TBL80537.1 glycosyl hydrolase [Paenibacillus thalictri]
MDTVQRTRKNRLKTVMVVLLLLLLVLMGAALFAYYWIELRASTEHTKPDFKGLAKPVYYKGKLLEQSAAGESESLKLPYALIKKEIDPNMLYEQASDSVIITTQDKVVRLKTSQLTAMINEKPFSLSFPVEKINDEMYVPIAPLLQLYSIQVKEAPQTGIIILQKQGDVIQWGKTAAIPKKPQETIALRKEPSIKAPIYEDVKQAAPVMIWSEREGWYYTQLENGVTGYMQKSDVVLDKVDMLPVQDLPDSFVPWKPIGGKINMTWEQVVTKTPDMKKVGPMPGVNVVSPTWFQLEDGQGTIKNLADPAYMTWARSKNLQVWALFSNGFEPKRTTEALSTYDKRMKMIKQLISYAQLYSLQGINIDFENVSLSDKDELVQFVREMTPFMHEQGLVVSMDVTVKSTNENWSMFYDRRALIETLDYMMVMAYDEHWATSPKAGSVASLPWVDRSVAQLLKEDAIPPSKLVLGVPFYARVWTEETKDGKTSVSSKAVTMDSVQQTIKDKKLTPAFQEDAGQNYVEYKDGNKLIKIWIEDETSMKARIDIVKKYGLAGVASWKRGLENASIWPVIQSALEKRP